MKLANVVAAAMFSGVTLYALFAGADFGAGFWDLLAGGSRRGASARELIEESIDPLRAHTSLCADRLREEADSQFFDLPANASDLRRHLTRRETADERAIPIFDGLHLNARRRRGDAKQE